MALWGTLLPDVLTARVLPRGDFLGSECRHSMIAFIGRNPGALGETVTAPAEPPNCVVAVQVCVTELISLLGSVFSMFPVYEYPLGASYTWLLGVSGKGLRGQVFRITGGCWQIWETVQNESGKKQHR